MQTKSGKQLFLVGIGTWMIAGTFDFDDDHEYKGSRPNYDNEAAEIEAIRYSIASGQNYIDCAEMYGGFYTDEVVGKAIVGLKREDLYIADKLWRNSVGPGQVRPTVEKMLQKLGTDYLDMLYIHAPWGDINWLHAVPQINDLIDEGIVRDFGVSNFKVKDIELAQSASKHPVAASQMDYSVLYREQVNDDYLKYCNDNGIQVVAYRPVKREETFTNKTIRSIAERHSVSPAQISIAWLLHQNNLVITKTITKKHIDDNITSVGLELDAEDVKALNSIRLVAGD